MYSESSGGKSMSGKKKGMFGDVDGTGIPFSAAENPIVFSLSSGGKPKSGHKVAVQRNAKNSFANKFFPLAHEESCEQTKGGGYPKRERKLTAKAVELDERNKKKSLNPESQTICPTSPFPINDPFLVY